MWRKVLWWWRSAQEQQELQDEIRAHLAIEIRQRCESGEDAESATREARRAFGNQTRILEQTREVWRFRVLDDLGQDIRHNARNLRRSPGFTAAAILLLALGIGANATIFRLLDAVMLRNLPVARPGELAVLELSDPTGWAGRRTSGFPVFSNPFWQTLSQSQHVFGGVLAWSDTTLQLGDRSGSTAVNGLFVSGSFFQVLGIYPQLGRLLAAADDIASPGSHSGCGSPSAVVSHAFWIGRMGGDPGAVGRRILLNSQPVLVAGVTPEGFTGPEIGRSFDVAVPICSQPLLGSEGNWLADGNLWWLTVMGRLAPGQTIETAGAGLGAASAGQFAATLPPGLPADAAKAYLNFKLRASPGAGGVSALRRQYNNPLVLLLAAAGLVLVLASANLANLIVARSAAREGEYAVRIAMGASRGRLIRQLMSESILLAVAGTLAGLALAAGLGPTLVAFLATQGSPLFLTLPLDLKLIVFVSATAALACTAFGLFPAILTARAAPGNAIRGSGRSLTGRRANIGVRQALVISQIALSLVLLFGALLFAGTLKNLMRVDLGFTPQGITVAKVDFSSRDLPAGESKALRSQLLDSIAAAPGVSSAAQVRHVPLGGTGSTGRFLFPDNPNRPVSVRVNAISPGYLKTMRIQLMAGRDFDAGDSTSASRVALVNQTFVRRFGLANGAVGTILRGNLAPGPAPDLIRIVGLVRDTKYFSLREGPIPIVFVPVAQDADPHQFVSIVIRSSLSLAGVRTMLDQATGRVSPGLAIEARAFDDFLQDGLQRERLLAALSGFFGALAVLIAAIGLYGVISYLVVRRTGEIGLRVALGASRRAILAMVLRQSARLVLTGLALGMAIAATAATSLRSFLFGLEPYDARLAALACVLLVAVTAAASYVPARRASRLDPVTALRKE